VIAVAQRRWDATIYDLLTAYARQRQTAALSHVEVAQRHVWSLAEARAILERLVGSAMDWTPLDAFLADYLLSEDRRASMIASSFASALELVREGSLELHQDRPLGPLYLRKRRDDAGSPPPAT
jgi:segregation and condensation protein A